MKLKKNDNIHFVGIGGIGMSGIASVLLEAGHSVSGSDLEANTLTRKIESLGGKVSKGHTPENIPQATRVVVYSSSIAADNAELVEAGRRGVKVIHRAEMLGEIFNCKKGVAVTGTHGKTTTTSLISVMMENLNLDPTVLIGGEVSLFKGNSKLGRGPYAVAEADESDSSFLHLRPFYLVMTNLEMEHVDHFKTLAAAKEAFSSFVRNLKKGGIVFYNNDDPNLRDIMKGYRGKAKSFGFSESSDIYPSNIIVKGFNTSFDCIVKGKLMGRVNLKIPGRHNVLNALASIQVGLCLGFKFEKIKRVIKDFTGAKRRFQLRSSSGNVMLIEDYAHHPTEIKAVLDICRNWNNKRVIVVFQPHRYTRTKFLADEFGRCFADADKLILTDIYSASEKPIRGVSIRNIYDRARKNGIEDVMMLDKDEISEYLVKTKKRGDLIIVLGAGDIKKVADDLAEKLNKTSSIAPELLHKFKKALKGKVRFAEPLSRHTSFRIGGPADIWAEPHDERDLKKILRFARFNRIKLFVIGNGTNILAGDKGYGGILVHLGSDIFKAVKFYRNKVSVGAGFSLPRLVRLTCERGLGGLESMVGIPGTVGGAIYMNAGGSTNPIFKNMEDLVISVRAMDYEGRIKNFKVRDIKFGYRQSNLDRYIILGAVLRLSKNDRATLLSDSARFLKMKREKQVLDMPSAGCVFKNPADFQFTCGQMIDMLGLKGKRIGQAEISGKHANFVVNRGGATCKDVLDMIDFIRKKTSDNYGVSLDLEIKII